MNNLIDYSTDWNTVAQYKFNSNSNTNIDVADTWTDRPLTNLLSTVITASGETIVPHRQ